MATVNSPMTWSRFSICCSNSPIRRSRVLAPFRVPPASAASPAARNSSRQRHSDAFFVHRCSTDVSTCDRGFSAIVATRFCPENERSDTPIRGEESISLTLVQRAGADTKRHVMLQLL